MKMRLRTWFALGAVALLAGVALADFNVRDHGTHFENASTGHRVNSSGDLTVEESSPAMDANLTFENIIVSTGTALAAADSSTVLDTHRMRLGMLLIKPVVAGTGTVDTTVIVRIAVQIRTHINAQDDSSSTFAVYPYGYAPSMVATTIGADTTWQGHMHKPLGLTAIAANVGPISPWSGEIGLSIQAVRNAHTNSVGVGSHQFYYPSGIAIPLQSLYGRDIYSPYTSVRVRIMTAQKGAASLSTATLAYTVHLVGTPL